MQFACDLRCSVNSLLAYGANARATTRPLGGSTPAKKMLNLLYSSRIIISLGNAGQILK